MHNVFLEDVNKADPSAAGGPSGRLSSSSSSSDSDSSSSSLSSSSSDTSDSEAGQIAIKNNHYQGVYTNQDLCIGCHAILSLLKQFSSSNYFVEFLSGLLRFVYQFFFWKVCCEYLNNSAMIFGIVFMCVKQENYLNIMIIICCQIFLHCCGKNSAAKNFYLLHFLWKSVKMF